MDRLTDYRLALEEGYYYVPANEDERIELLYSEKPSYREIYNRLAQYENLGVSPEDINDKYYIPPCAIGDTMWCIKNQSGKMTAQSGIVNEMFYTPDMRLMIVVKYVGRGHYGDKIFSDRESCQKRADELNKEGKIC